MDNVDEKKLMQGLSRGEEKAFETIFKEFFPGLCQYAFFFVKSKSVAEEIVEELFLHIWENAGSISITNSLRHYLFRSVYNRCLKYLRHLSVEQKYVKQVQHSVKEDEFFLSASDGFPQSDMMAKELRYEIRKAIQNLPGECRKIFLLHRKNDLTYAEISEKLDISVNTVKTQMNRALHKIRESLKGYLSFCYPAILLFLY